MAARRMVRDGAEAAPPHHEVGLWQAEETAMVPQLATKYVFSLAIKIGAPIVAGDLGHGVRRVIPITGGTVRGEAVNGTIFPCGADFQIIRPDGFTELEAKY